MMAKIISVNMQKGGSGKTTTIQALAGCLSDIGFNCLLVDLDPNANLTFSSNINYIKYDVYDLMHQNIDYDEAIQLNSYYDIIPSGTRLNKAEQEFNDLALKNVLEPLRNRYDFILIDTPPCLGTLFRNSLVAADYVLIPVEPSFYAYQALHQLYDIINDVTVKYNQCLKILGFLLVKYRDKEYTNRIVNCLVNKFAWEHKLKVFNTFIHESCIIKEAQGLQDNIIKTHPKSRPSIDYMMFTNELLDILHENRLLNII